MRKTMNLISSMSTCSMSNDESAYVETRVPGLYISMMDNEILML
jgi:hypothetical protein